MSTRAATANGNAAANDGGRPRISVLVPTRNRAQYLGACLATILAIDDSRLEIVVSDNSSEDATPDVLAAISDPRLKIVRTAKMLAMNDNFEFGLAATTGDYVIVIGDDDGLLPGMWGTLVDTIMTHRPEIVNWDPIQYTWPRDPQTGLGGQLQFFPRHVRGSIEKIDTRQRFGDFCAARRLKYRDGGNIYHGCVSRAVIDRVHKAAGRYFYAFAPDVGAAIANLCATSQILFLGKPITIAGSSPHSTGAAAKNWERAASSGRGSFEQYQSEVSKVDDKPRLGKGARSLRAITLDALYLACDYFNRDHAAVNIARWYAMIESELKRVPVPVRRLQMALVRDWMQQRGLECPRSSDPPATPREEAQAVEVGPNESEVAAAPPSKHRIRFDRVVLGTRSGYCEDVFQAAQRSQAMISASMASDTRMAPFLQPLSWARLMALAGKEVRSIDRVRQNAMAARDIQPAKGARPS